MESLKLDPYPHMPLFQPEVDLPATEFHDEYVYQFFFISFVINISLELIKTYLKKQELVVSPSTS